MSDERPFITVQHPFNLRWAILEDDGVGAWLYLTEPDRPEPISDCLVYSCIEPVAEIPASWDRTTPPPLTSVFATERAWQPDATQSRIRVAWSSSGTATVVLMDDEPVAFLAVGDKQGFSKSIERAGVYGHPWDEVRFEQLFVEHLEA
jgi:hypothetical protein